MHLISRFECLTHPVVKEGEVNWGEKSPEDRDQKKGKTGRGKPASQICIDQSEARYEFTIKPPHYQ